MTDEPTQELRAWRDEGAICPGCGQRVAGLDIGPTDAQLLLATYGEFTATAIPCGHGITVFLQQIEDDRG